MCRGEHQLLFHVNGAADRRGIYVPRVAIAHTLRCRGSQIYLYCFGSCLVGESTHAGPEMDLSLHGEHGGLLDASKRLHSDQSSGSTGYLPKLSVPLFGSNDGGL
jgi:hypothetical protein